MAQHRRRFVLLTTLFVPLMLGLAPSVALAESGDAEAEADPFKFGLGSATGLLNARQISDLCGKVDEVVANQCGISRDENHVFNAQLHASCDLASGKFLPERFVGFVPTSDLVTLVNGGCPVSVGEGGDPSRFAWGRETGALSGAGLISGALYAGAGVLVDNAIETVEIYAASRAIGKICGASSAPLLVDQVSARMLMPETCELFDDLQNVASQSGFGRALHGSATADAVSLPRNIAEELLRIYPAVYATGSGGVTRDMLIVSAVAARVMELIVEGANPIDALAAWARTDLQAVADYTPDWKKYPMTGAMSYASLLSASLFAPEVGVSAKGVLEVKWDEKADKAAGWTALAALHNVNTLSSHLPRATRLENFWAQIKQLTTAASGLSMDKTRLDEGLKEVAARIKALKDVKAPGAEDQRRLQQLEQIKSIAQIMALIEEAKKPGAKPESVELVHALRKAEPELFALYDTWAKQNAITVEQMETSVSEVKNLAQIGASLHSVATSMQGIWLVWRSSHTGLPTSASSLTPPPSKEDALRAVASATADLLRALRTALPALMEDDGPAEAAQRVMDDLSDLLSALGSGDRAAVVLKGTELALATMERVIDDHINKIKQPPPEPSEGEASADEDQSQDPKPPTINSLHILKRELGDGANLVAGLYAAETVEEIEHVLDLYVASPGSYIEKRHRPSLGYVIPNGYVGWGGGLERMPSLVTKNDQGEVINDGQDWATWPVVAVGPEFGLRLGRTKAHPWTLGVFVPVLDLGVLAQTRLGDPDTANLPTVGLRGVVSPGAYLSVGLGLCDLPVALQFGGSWAPALREITEDNQLVEESAIRYGVNVVVDVPLRL